MTTAENSTGFGSYLRNHRRAMGIPIEAVSQKTKVRVEVLRHIENEDMGHLPSPTFVKGFVRAYAEAIGADAQEALRRFKEGCVADAQTTAACVPQKPKLHFWRGFLFACLALILLVFISLYIARRMETPHGPTDPPLAEEVTSPRAEPLPSAAAPTKPDAPAQVQETEVSATSTPDTPEATPEAALPSEEENVPDDADANATAAVVPVEPAKLVLQIAAVELTWVRVTMDGREVKEMTLAPNDHMTFEAEQQFDLVIGNGGGIQLTLNDQPLGFPGKRGKVISLKLP